MYTDFRGIKRTTNCEQAAWRVQSNSIQLVLDHSSGLSEVSNWHSFINFGERREKSIRRAPVISTPLKPNS